MSLIEAVYLTPQEKAERISYFYSIYKDDPKDTPEQKETKAYTRWCMKLLVNGNFQNFKGYEDVPRPTIDDWKRAHALTERGCFITVCLPKEHKINPDKLMEKLISVSSFKKFIFCAEFYSGAESNLNKHYHIFLYGKQHKGNTVKLFSRFFKIAPNFVDVVQTYENITNNQKIKYIKGEKITDKQHNVLLDRKHRQEINIKDFYEYNL